MSELLNNNILLTIILVIGTFVTLQVSKYFLRKIGLTKDGYTTPICQDNFL